MDAMANASHSITNKNRTRNDSVTSVSSTVTVSASADNNNNNSNVNSKYQITTATIETAISGRIRAILQSAQLAGFTSITISANSWISRTQDVRGIASEVGVLVHCEFDPLNTYPQELFNKPVVAGQQFVHAISAAVEMSRSNREGEGGGGGYASSGKHQLNGRSVAVFPAFMDGNFMTPILMLKYYCFLHAGTCVSN